MIQNAIAAVIVVLAALHVARKYLPARWRIKIVYFFTAHGASQVTMARWLGTGSSCGSGSGCGSGNDGCKACAQPAPTEHVIKIVRR